MVEFVSGPLVWIAFLVFIFGSLLRLASIARLAAKEKVVLPFMSPKHGFRSIMHWITPYGSVNMRRHPAFTLLSFLFHICLLATPVFLLGHIVLWRESWGFSWWSLPEGLATVMTLVVIAVGIVFALRRLVDPAVRYVTTAADFLVLAVVLAPFVTGILAYFQVFEYETMITLHIVTGAIWLMAIPFTRLIHMLLFPFTRGYMGGEFGFVRNARDW